MNLFPRRNRMGDLSAVREFIYLDEISVESLLASVDGEILVQSTQTQSSSVEAGAAATGPDLFDKSAFSSSLKVKRGEEIQELRKSVAQSAFARFRARNQQRFAIRAEGSIRIGKRDRRRLEAMNGKVLRRLRQGIRVADLRRGDLLEIDTNLAAADIFKARTAMNAVSDVIQAYPTFLSIEQRDVFKAVRPLTDLIDKLNGNAIPIVGAAPSIRIAEIDGEEWLIQTAGDASGVELALESVAQPQWFWGDVGRTLFQGNRFRVLCRVISPELSLTPPRSYVGTILRTIDDGLASTVAGLGTMFLASMREGHKSAGGVSASSALPLVAWYVAALRIRGAADPDAATESKIVELGSMNIRSLTISDQSLFFETLERLLVADGEISVDDLADLRDDARTEFNLWPWSIPSSESQIEATPADAVKYLEVEIVAAYW